MNKVTKKICAVMMSALSLGGAMTLAACGARPPEGAEGKTIIYFNAIGCDTNAGAAYNELVETYNSTQGETDGVYVQLNPNSARSNGLAGLDSQLRQNYRYDVVEIADGQFKTLGTKDFFVKLDGYLTEDVKTAMQWDQIPDALANRFRMNTSIDPAYGKYGAGAGTAVQAIPNGNDPMVLWYNKSILQNLGINIISVAEDELATAESGKYASVKPHGYAEYLSAPFEGAESSVNEAGETVFKVFNNRIGMNWEELRCLARAFQKGGHAWGYMSEWWFNYGFSVGGDCIGWNETAKKYEFTVCDKQVNYLATDAVTVNGSSYEKGEILRYEDKTYLNNNASALAAAEDKLYVMHSQYDAFLEFNRLGVPKDREADVGINGYGLAPTTTEDRASHFTSGASPFLVEYYSNAASYAATLRGKADIAMNVQYRKYVGGSTYQKDGEPGFANEYLKVIGKDYGGTVYTGDLEERNGVKIVGRTSTASQSTGFAIPKNTRNKNYDSAFKFVVWAAGPEGQTILYKGKNQVPNQVSIGAAKNLESLGMNTKAAAASSRFADLGDYSYFSLHTWIDAWSQDLNKAVREGKMTLTQFITNKKGDADNALAAMPLRLLGR